MTGPRVLLVEDDEVIREIYALKFEMEGLPIATAYNGAEALALLPQFDPDIILLDMMMPVMGGLEFMQKLSATRAGFPTVIVFSNISAAHHTQEILNLGASDYWVKSDYTPEGLVREVCRRWQEIHAL
jgi:CheY-like chemotaxis protein